MKAVAFSNNDIAVVAWTFDGKLNGCLGFAVYRIDVLAGTETCLPAIATFQNQPATAGRTTADDPVQKFFWKDVYAKRGGTYKYKIVPLGGNPGSLQPMPYGPLISNQIQLTPHYGALSVYFNRGILATQATASAIDATPGGGQMAEKLTTHIYKVGDPLRYDLARQMVEALTTLPDEALQNRDELHCAFYEFDDPEVIAHLDPLKGSLNLILSNMPGTVNKTKTNDTYADQRAAIKAAGANVHNRFMAGNHIGHNKFQVLVEKGVATAALFGSTNVTAHGLCAQTNSTIVARSAGVAAAYDAYWNRLLKDTLSPGPKVTGPQAASLRTPNAKGPTIGDLEDGSGAVDLWFSPNTPKARAKQPGKNESCPPDLQELFKLITQAQQAILFLVFDPGYPSIVDTIAAAQKANPSLFVRGAVTDASASGEFYTAVNGGQTPVKKPKKGAPRLPEDYRVIHTRGVTKGDAFGQWSQELNQAGHAVIHDKIVVIDPFSDNCVVAMGSHNDGYKASYNNDENLAIIKTHRAVTEAYAAHCLSFGPLIAGCCQASFLTCLLSTWHDGSARPVGAGQGCGDGASADGDVITTQATGGPRFTGPIQGDRVDVIAGVMVLSEVKRLMMMSGPGASTCASECGRTATSRMNEVTTTTVPADIAGPVNRVRNFECGSCCFGRAPLERRAVDPNAMEDHRDLACDGDLRLLHSDPLGKLHPPSLQGRPLLGAMKQH